MSAPVKVTHTPGPWLIGKHEDVDVFYVGPDLPAIGTTGREVASIYGRNENPETAKADARLIAAAPELLAALKGLVDAIGAPFHNLPELDAARAAIAKAEGGAA